MTRVLVAADSAVVRAGLESLLTRGATIDVVGSSAGGPELVGHAVELHPDVVLLELDPHESDPRALIRDLAVRLGETAIVVLAGDGRDVWALDALRAGVRCVLSRDASEAEIVAAVEAVAAGLVVVGADAIGALMPVSRPLPGPRADGERQPLTPREVEILNLLAEGLGNKAIAPRLGISEHTVKFHLGSIFSKLGVSTRTEAVTVGARMGVILL